MYNREALPSDYTRVIEAEPDKLDIKRRDPGILFISYPLIHSSNCQFRFPIESRLLDACINHNCFGSCEPHNRHHNSPDQIGNQQNK